MECGQDAFSKTTRLILVGHACKGPCGYAKQFSLGMILENTGRSALTSNKTMSEPKHTLV